MKVKIAPSFFKSLKNLNSLKNKWYRFIAWIKYHFNKDFLRIIITAFKGYPWQDDFLYELERAKIQEMMNYHNKVRRFVDVEYVIRDMQICLNLIDIILNQEDLYTYDGEINYVKTEDGNYEMVPTENFKYHCLVNVNISNISRFIKNEKIKEYYIKNPHEIYILKAKYLYHKIRYEHDAEWWD